MSKFKKVIISALAIFMLSLTGPLLVAEAAPKPTSTITIADGVYGSTTIGTISTPRTDTEVFVQCYLLDGTYVYAAIFPNINGQAVIGPFAATTWAIPSAANCKAELGYVTRDGWGKWRVLATTSFNVVA